MAEKKETITLEDGRAVKVAMVAVFNFLTLAKSSLLEDVAFTKLLVAGKGGFNGEDSFVTIDGNKVARICAMTGAVFAHNNADKSVSFFYKNGSYMIGAEIVKANARKAWELDKEARELTLEDDMLEGVITPKEWKEQDTAIKSEEFTFELDETVKADLIADFGGYATKEDFITAYNADEVLPFTEFDEEVKALRALAPQRPTVEDEEA